MAASLEVRVPLLDHRVVEFVWVLPPAVRFRGRRASKRLRRGTLYKYVPQRLVARPKRGFPAPMKAWLRGPLSAWADDLLAEPRLRENGSFHPAPVRRPWTEHRASAANHWRLLWSLLMFQAWKANQAAAWGCRLPASIPSPNLTPWIGRGNRVRPLDRRRRFSAARASVAIMGARSRWRASPSSARWRCPGLVEGHGFGRAERSLAPLEVRG